MILEGIKVHVAGFNPSLEETQAYVDYVKEHAGKVSSINIQLNDDDTVDIVWVQNNRKFERIRRITGVD